MKPYSDGKIMTEAIVILLKNVVLPAFNLKLKRFYDPLPEIKMFAKGKTFLSSAICAWLADLAFMINVNTHFSSPNHILQGNSKQVLYMYSAASDLIKKLCL